MTAQRYEASLPFEKKFFFEQEERHFVFPSGHVMFYLLNAGFLLEAGSRVPAPVYFEQSARLLKLRN